MLDDDRYLAQLCGLAANPSLPRQLLDRLVTAASGELHDQPGSGEPRDHPGAFELLADPLEPRSRLSIDERRTNGPGVLRSRRGVVEPRDLAEFLAMTDSSPMIPPRLPSEPVTEPGPQESVWKNGLHIQATKNPDCSPELLHHIAQTANPDSVVHTEVAKHPNTTAETLLLCLAEPAARRHAARHPNLPPHIITDLLDDPDLLVAEAAAANPALPPKIMEALLA